MLGLREEKNLFWRAIVLDSVPYLTWNQLISLMLHNLRIESNFYM